MKLRVFTAFSGYDSQCLALDRLKANFPDFDYELVGWSEIDKYAIQAHNALYPQWADRNFGDISKIDWSQVPDFDLFTYSSPCQERIRKLTPREYFRLMGVDEADIDKIQASGISNSQQYKMAGNSIVVDVLYHIFRQAFCEEKPKARYIQQTLF